MTLQRIILKTEWMMEKIRLNAIDATIEKFKAADRHYYETCEGGKEVTALIHELERLGVDDEAIIEMDLSIRDEVFGL